MAVLKKYKNASVAILFLNRLETHWLGMEKAHLEACSKPRLVSRKRRNII